MTGQPDGNFPAVILNAGLKSGHQRALPMFYQGVLKKMRARSENPVRYELPVGDFAVPLNEYVGQTIRLQYTGRIFCLNCGQKTAKSFSQGFCYKCFRSSAAADMCIMKPETCHFHLGTCREPEWALSHCFQPHVVYLANSSGLKVGITRATQMPTRWLDQGARQALPIMTVATRLQAGLAEVIFANHISDKTAWQRLLKEEAPDLDLALLRDELLNLCADELAALQARFPGELQVLTSGEALEFRYPVQQYPVKVKAFNLDNDPAVNGKLMGIKGQYLILDTGVINIRKYGGYEIEFGEKNV